MSDRKAKMEARGYEVDRPMPPGAIYRPVAITGTTAYVSGAVPMDNGALVSQGKVPSVISLEEAQAAAALCAANNLRMLYQEIGSLEKIESILRLTGYVNTDPDFTDHHLVINGASQFLLDVLGDAGLAARTAIGMAQLPLEASVETEMIVQLKE